MLVDKANDIYIAMHMCNLIEYSDNYSNTSGNLWQFKGDKVPAKNVDLSIDNSKSFKYKAALLGKPADAADGTSFVKNTKTVVPLKYLSNFWRSLEMLLINFKIHLELTFILNQGTNIYELLSGLSQKVKRLFVNAYFIAVNIASNEPAIKKEIIFHKGRLKIMKLL